MSSESVEEQICNDPRAGVETVSTAWTGIIITTITSSISIVASGITIFLILRSAKRLSTPYNRIIFGLSLTVMVSMISISFTTLPMPKDMIYKQFAGISLGNVTTCSIQGFGYFFGTLTSALYNGVLCVYYLCSIVFRTSDEQFKRFPEPLLHGLTLLFGIGVPCFYLTQTGMNPSPHATWCILTKYPWWCNYTEERDALICESQNDSDEMYVMSLRVAIAITLVGMVFIGLISFTIIIWTIYNRERMLAPVEVSQSRVSRENEREMNAYKRDLQYTKAVLVQCLVYALAAALVFTPIAIRAVRRSRGLTPYGNQYIHIVFLILRPLQGLFNFFIFIYLKIYTMRCIQGNAFSLFEALTKIFRPTEEEEYAISHLSLLGRDIEHNRILQAFEARYHGENDDQENRDPSVPAGMDVSVMNHSSGLSVSFDSKVSSHQNLSGFYSHAKSSASFDPEKSSPQNVSGPSYHAKSNDVSIDSEKSSQQNLSALDSHVISNMSFDSENSSSQNLSGFDSRVICNVSSYEVELRPSRSS